MGCYHTCMLIFLIACGAEPDSSENSDQTGSSPDLCDVKASGNLDFPVDDGPHVGSPEERWSWAGRVKDGEDRAYRLSLEFFSADGQTGAVATLLPEADLVRAVKVEGEGSAASTGGFVLEAGVISAVGGEGRDVLSATTDTGSWELVVAERKQVIIHEETAKWTGYSRPRMSAHGQIFDATGERLEVEGELWFEHVWGGGSGPEQRVQLSLEDGRDFRVLSDSTQTRVQGQGADCAALDPGEASWVADLSWGSPQTGCTWPVAGTVAVGTENWGLAPLLQDQEVLGVGGARWWGAMAVSGSGPGTAFLRASGDCP